MINLYLKKDDSVICITEDKIIDVFRNESIDVSTYEDWIEFPQERSDKISFLMHKQNYRTCPADDFINKFKATLKKFNEL